MLSLASESETTDFESDLSFLNELLNLEMADLQAKAVPPRNPYDSTYVDWLIAVVDGKLEKPPSKPVSSLKKIA